MSLLLALLVYGKGLGQDCAITIGGTVLDAHNGEPMPYVSLYDSDRAIGTQTDLSGEFTFEGICAGPMHLRINHVGCEEVRLYLDIRQDTSFTLRLHHHAELLDEVVVSESATDRALGEQSVLSTEKIIEAPDKGIGEMLTQVPGVSAIRTGSDIVKPVLHGMSGNRLTLLNNGVAHSGQQWGMGHAPEIDPRSADRLTVIKGANTLAYNGEGMGVILLEKSPIPNEPHIHGLGSYGFNTTDLGHALHLRLQQGMKGLSWRADLSAQSSSDGQTPDHFLTNTASRGLNGAFTLEKTFKQRLRSELYYSVFNSEIGILRGAHISNVTDLLSALNREEPFFTSDQRDRDISNPRQVVGHHLFKLHNRYLVSDSLILDLTYALQLNSRDEYDVRRAGRDELPALSLSKEEHFTELKMKWRTAGGRQWRAGLQHRFARNSNDPETGILPLIPDYLQSQYSLFLLHTARWNRWEYTVGARWDTKNLYALTISNSLPREIIREDLWFHTPSASISTTYTSVHDFKLNAEIGYRERSPAVNELFSYGLHQGVSGIEEGDRDLQNEKGIKALLGAEYHLHEKVFFDVVAYVHHIDKYIYLEPQDELRQTIRGAFPVFEYAQVDGLIRGVDARVSAELNERWRTLADYSWIRGEERRSARGLLGIPSDRLNYSVEYAVPTQGLLNEFTLDAGLRHVFERQGILTDNSDYPDRSEDSALQGQDFLPPPDPYTLFSLGAETKMAFGATSFTLGLDVENLLNTRYREYLDRFRYFADARGREIRWRLTWRF
ncbi:MAG: TonB-dependent receptor [Flavobacteriales bacterium]|nr:TonB-dependent receptor [Flavobacteriales bacterium]